ncbi:MAG: hypothetical protein AB7O48_19415 [Cyclobacteriaceae bacterium]
MDKGHLTGVVTTESLGRGNVVIELDKTRGATFVKVNASRVEKYRASNR